MTLSDEKHETPQEQGKIQGDYYLLLFAKDLSLDAWLAFGGVVAPHFQTEKLEQEKFLVGWQDAWENRQLLIELLSDEDQIIVECTRLSDRRKLVIERQIYHRARLCIGGPPPSHPLCYDTTFDYTSPQEALDAMQNWNTEQSPEPTGWIRHRDTGRYRINGDAALEWVKDDDHLSLEQNLGYAIKATQGQDRIATNVEDKGYPGDVFPATTQFFIVTSRSSTCPHEEPCEWLDHVYHYCDRSVVVGFNEMHKVKLGNVLQRLKGGK